MTHAWGQYDDPDTAQGIEFYQRSGLRLWTPDQVATLSLAEMTDVAQACGNLIDGTYNGNYPQSVKNVELLIESIAVGETLVFMLSKDERAVATASLIRRSNNMGGRLGFVELSKTAKHREYAKDIQVRYLSKYRLMWAADNLPDVDFLYGSPRAALKGSDGTQGGRRAQSVWWGGRKYGTPLPLVATNVGWNFRIGGIEPLTGFAVPLNVGSWVKAVRKLAIYVPNHELATNLNTLIHEGTDGVVKPNVQSLDDGLLEKPIFREARKPLPDVVSKYYVTDDANHLPLRSSDDINAQLPDTISQKVIIESDIATTARGAHIMRWLLGAGWTFTGWQPSEVIFGGICPMFARVNSKLLHELIEPMHFAQYFDAGGLHQTKRILDDMYSAMRLNALEV